MRAWLLPSIGAVVLLCVLSVFSGKHNTQHEPRKVTRPRDLQGYYQKLLDFWENKLEADPFSYIARKKIASTKIEFARATGNERLYREAEIVLTEASKFAPGGEDDAEHQLLVGRVLMSRHRFSEALTILESSLRTEPQSWPLRLSKGDALCGLGRYEECRELFAALVQEKPCFDTWVRLAQVEESMSELDEALRLIALAKQETKHLKPESEAWIMVRLAIIELKQNELEAAEQHLREALALYPDYYLAQEHLAEIFERRSQWDAAREWLERAIKLNEDPHFLERLAKVLENIGDARAARDLNHKALMLLEDRFNQEAGAHARDLADALIRRGNSKRAIELVKIDLELRPGDIQSNQVAAQAYRLAGDFAQAEQYSRMATRYSSSS